MLIAESHHAAALSAEDAAAWRALCAAEPAFESPLLGPDFTQVVAEVRDDARVAIWRKEGRAVAFLPHHLRPGGFARPIGSPFSDYHALVSDGHLDGPTALAMAGLSAFRFTGLVDPYGIFAEQTSARSQGYVIALDGTATDYLERLRAQSAKRFKNYRRLASKIEREVGPLTVAAPDLSRDAFDKLLDWKQAQLNRTGLHDFLAADWARELLERFYAQRTGEFQGMVVGLYADGRLISGQFGVRLGDVFHPWIASTDPEMGAWSPGQLFFLQAIAAMPGAGLRIYDLAGGHEHYKRPFALSTREIGEGVATAANAAGRSARMSEAAWALAGANRNGAAASLRRRLDIIATTELSLAGRAKGLAAAFAGRARRHAADTEAP